jgi:hypothetical protein
MDRRANVHRVGSVGRPKAKAPMNDEAIQDLSAKDKKTRRRLVFAVFLSFWSLTLISGIIDVTGRHVPDYPNAIPASLYVGQSFYVVIPFAFVLLNLLFLFFSRRFPTLLVGAILVAQLGFLAAFLVLGGGGI